MKNFTLIIPMDILLNLLIIDFNTFKPAKSRKTSFLLNLPFIHNKNHLDIP